MKFNRYFTASILMLAYILTTGNVTKGESVIEGNNDSDINASVDATYESPFTFMEEGATKLDLLAEKRNLLKSLSENPRVLKCITDNSPSRTTNLAKMLLDNPGRFIIQMDVDPKSPRSQQLLEKGNRADLERPAQLWLDRQINSSKNIIPIMDANEAEDDGKTVMPIDKLVGIGASHLERNFLVTFLFVEGNGPANFDWNEDLLNYALDEAELAIIRIIFLAESNGIVLRPTIQYGYVPIPFEPQQSPSGISYLEDLNTDGLDPLRTSIIESYGFTGSGLEALYEFNKYWMGEYHQTQGVVGFIFNLDNQSTHTTGESPNWANTWNADYGASKPYFTTALALNTDEGPLFSSHVERSILKLFGATEEFAGSEDCYNSACCNSTSGELVVPNGNCAYCADDPCIMKSLASPNDICQYTAQQVGWRDSDGDYGSDVAELPVPFTSLVTGDFKVGDLFTVRTIGGAFVDAFIVGSDNSYKQPSGELRTIQVSGMNYLRSIIAPGIYYGNINGGAPFTFLVDIDNNHPPLEISEIASFGPYLTFVANGVGHLHMKIRNQATSEIYWAANGQLLPGDNTLYNTMFNDQFVPDGLFPNNNWTWNPDNVDAFKSGTHLVNYGVPEPWTIDNIEFIPESRVISTSGEAKLWTQSAKLYEKNLISYHYITDLLTGMYEFEWGADYHTSAAGSDSVWVTVVANNPNGVSTSSSPDNIYAILPPVSPMTEEGKCVFEVLGVTEIVWDLDCIYQTGDDGVTKQMAPRQIPGNVHKAVNDAPKDCYYIRTTSGNAIKATISLPTQQVASKMDKYVVICGGYEDGIYIRRYDTVAADKIRPGIVNSTFYNLKTNQQYNLSVNAIDIRGNESGFTTPYVAVTTGSAGISPGKETLIQEYIDFNGNILPFDFFLSQNYPNPFNPSTNIAFYLPAAGKVDLTVYNILGQKVETLVDGYLDAGRHTVQWDASNQPSGIYFYRLKTDSNVETRKMSFVK